MAVRAFAKYEGLGNDFVVVDAPAEDVISKDDVVALCDRRRGIGADGVLLVLPPSAGGLARMKVLNADGSVPEMCGNGLRCVVLHLAIARGLEQGELVVETDAGPRRCAFTRRGDAGEIVVDMGPARVGEDVALEVLGRTVTLTRVDTGNPHAIVKEPVAREDVEALGRELAAHPTFPAGTNVEFAAFHADAVDLVVFERGVGLTLACGTGACATVAAGVAWGILPKDVDVDVRLPGGLLAIRIDGTSAARMRGPARLVFAGQLAGPGAP